MKTGSSLATGWRTWSNHTLVCFHSKKVVRTADGPAASHRRSDRNAGRPRRPGGSDRSIRGPVYGPPMIHHTSREATFVFDFPAAAGNGQKESSINASGTTSMFREDFPQLVRTVISTYLAARGSGMSTVKCRTRMKPIAAPNARGRTSQLLDFPTRLTRPTPRISGVPTNFNAIVGNHLTVSFNCVSRPRVPKNKRQRETKGSLDDTPTGPFGGKKKQRNLAF